MGRNKTVPVRTGLLLCTHSCTHRFSIRLFFSSKFFFLPTYRIYHKVHSDEGQRSRYTRKMAEGHSAILGKIHEPSLSCVLCYGRIATVCSSVRCRKSQMDKPKKRVTMPRYNGVTIKAPHPPPPPSTPTVHRYGIYFPLYLDFKMSELVWGHSRFKQPKHQISK